jgi:hypothetical protein
VSRKNIATSVAGQGGATAAHIFLIIELVDTADRTAKSPEMDDEIPFE